MSINILQAIDDPNLFRKFLEDADGSLQTWAQWRVALKALYGHPITTDEEKELVRECTGRSQMLPTTGFDTALFLTGRRSGKSRVAALIGAFEACLSGRETRLSRGEIGLVAIISPTKEQSRIVRSYLRAVFDSTDMLRNEVAEETKEGFTLKSGVECRALVGSFKQVRGYSLVSAILDELAFFFYDEDAKVKSDTELIRAIKPALATTGGRLIGISSPYARRGFCYQTYKRNFGSEGGKTLVWNSPSRTMNPTLPQSVVDDAYAEDPASASAEYGGQFRDDIQSFVSREMVEALVIEGRKELPPMRGLQYAAFADVSGGRSDDAAICIAHAEGRMVVVDYLERFKSPHNPNTVIAHMCHTLRHYGIDRCLGDAYAAEFTKTAFESCGIKYERCSTSAWKTGADIKNKIAKPKSQLYLELLPRLSTGEIELLDNPTLVDQLSNLQRKVRSGGKDVIEKVPGSQDGVANACAGVCDAVQQRPVIVGRDLFVPNSVNADGGYSPGSAAYQRALRLHKYRVEQYAKQQLNQPSREQEHVDTFRSVMKSFFPRSDRY